MFLPGDTQNLTKASLVEFVEPFLLRQVGSLGLTPIQESADHTNIIDGYLDFSVQLRVVPYSRDETTKGCCFLQPDVQLGIQGEVVCHSRPKIVGGVDNLQLCVVN